jgi:hypothetical protein
MSLLFDPYIYKNYTKDIEYIWFIWIFFYRSDN